MINRAIFFDVIRRRLFGGAMSQSQIDGINMVLDEWEAQRLTDERRLAYMLATDKHETNATMLPVREAYYLNPPGPHQNDASGPAERWRKANLRYYPWYGRGLVQLTWRDNYVKMNKALHDAGIEVDIVKDPDLAMRPDVAVFIMFEGMLRAETGVGDFTNHSLEMYFNDRVDDPVGARRIINGTDKAREIAGYHNEFLSALKAATP